MLQIGKLFNYMHVDHTLTFHSIKSLESQISDLESESERISRALDNQRLTTSEIEATAAKKLEDVSRELQKKVCTGENVY
jgi:MFS superfamily sulfate permease-like transporter